MDNYIEILRTRCGEASFNKLKVLENQKLHQFVAKYIDLCNPESVYVCDASEEDRDYIRNKAVEKGEEKKLNIEGHTVHFDGYFDQARDKANTKYLLPEGANLGEQLNSIEKGSGLEEVMGFLKESMAGKEMFVLFFCLGPENSPFSIPCVQITDSAYVAHSEYILYRRGYNQFKSIGGSDEFFQFVHTAGELDGNVSKNIDKRRVYIDLEANTVYSTNTQYAGNTVGLKKLALRLAIQKASQDGNWLAEHMFVMASKGPDGRKTYFTGAFPSACGKTSTAMLQGETIIGDDIAYLRAINGELKAVNVEKGIFGIIRDVNPEDDPVIWDVLNTPGEAIFSNVLVDETNSPRWLGDGREEPEKGINYSGEWHKNKTDDDGKAISYSHKNSRYTVSLYDLKNVDSEIDAPEGVFVSGVIYGGRDSSILPPLQEAFGWEHGIVTMGASLESETTAATLGQEGVRVINPMSNIDFVSVPLSTYIASNLNMAKQIEKAPSIFAVNYFKKGEDGKYLTGMDYKRVWVKWMERRVHGDVDVIETPTGNIPKHEDLKALFKEVLQIDYSEDDYNKQFTIDIDENLAKIERVKDYYAKSKDDLPAAFNEQLDEQKKRLEAAKERFGNTISPLAYSEK